MKALIAYRDNPDVIGRIKAIAKAKGITTSAVIREAIERYLKTYKKQ